ncbi:hypothetical protein EDD29_4125 [Actinocorallia herbida]|uniref:Uncharacterized protein n=1 Tax=Actinocorallia herbida TaxID=58109 RepID=A0A3N1CZ77_9ACTN|nr:hypothetical protein [Actinocorallia herbida]ROO86552.1 hypothetical protein EDD29_4125 [Actinocorallia herbida]
MMDRVIDLDRAAAEIVARAAVWTEVGLGVSPVTWRDGRTAWPYRLENDRALITDPDSLGLRVHGPDGEAELVLVLYRGGWADLDLLIADEIVVEVATVETPDAFGAFLDAVMTRFLGAPSESGTITP